MTKQFFASILILSAGLIISKPVFAAKPRLPSISKKQITSKNLGYSTVRLSRPTNSIKVNFINLTSVVRINYTLSYTASGIDQGVIGSISVNGQSTETRDLYFGTCSKGVCTPHRNLKNITLLVTTTLKNGKTSTKKYHIRL